MKFSEIDEASWPDLQPYFDTVLLPVTGLTGLESPPEAAERIALTGQWLVPLEGSFRGRTVTYPASHYDGAAGHFGLERLNALCSRIKEQGFRHVVVVSGTGGWDTALLPQADLVIQPLNAEEEPDADMIRKRVTELWKSALVGQ